MVSLSQEVVGGMALHKYFMLLLSGSIVTLNRGRDLSRCPFSQMVSS